MGLLEETIAKIAPLDADAMRQARERQDQLTKPTGSLGRLEALSIQIAGITGVARPRLAHPAVVVMAGDHGIARQGVSPYPTDVTPQMVLNFLSGGAAINALARHVGAQVVVADMGVASDLPDHPALIKRKVAYGTADFTAGPAMSREQARQSLEAGIQIAQQVIAGGADLLATGDMGIGNTTPSSAIVAAITGEPVAAVTGRGSGVGDEALARKISAIEQALALHSPHPTDGLGLLAALGGFEIGGLAGLILGAAAARVPVVVDGFISSAAAMLALTLAPESAGYMVPGHRSVERGQRAFFARIDAEPLLDLGMRLGEGTGAVLAQSLCQAACKALDEMATFAEAGVSDKQ